MNTPLPQSASSQDSGNFFDFLVSCIDPRFTALHTRHMLQLGREGRYSDFSIAGGALAAISHQNPSWPVTLWENLALSMQIHGVNRLVFLGHEDCAAVKQWAQAQPNLRHLPELEWHNAIFTSATAEAQRRFPNLNIQCRVIFLSGDVLHCNCGPANTAQPTSSRMALPASAAIPSSDRQGFVEFIKAAMRSRNTLIRDERRALAIGVTEYGLSATEAREVFFAHTVAHDALPQEKLTDEVTAFLRMRATKQGVVRKADIELAIALVRRRAETSLSWAEADRLVREMMLRENLRPRRLTDMLLGG